METDKKVQLILNQLRKKFDDHFMSYYDYDLSLYWIVCGNISYLKNEDFGSFLSKMSKNIGAKLVPQYLISTKSNLEDRLRYKGVPKNRISVLTSKK